MQFANSEIPAIGKALDPGCHLRQIILEDAKIVSAALAKGGGNDFQRTLIDHYLCFLRMLLLLAAIMSYVALPGRSIGCSVASISTTLSPYTPGLECFLARVNGNLPEAGWAR